MRDKRDKTWDNRRSTSMQSCPRLGGGAGRDVFVKSYLLRAVAGLCCIGALLAAVGGGATLDLILAGVLWAVALVCAFVSMGDGGHVALPWRKLDSAQNDYLREQFEKAEADCNALRDAAGETQDPALRAQLVRMDNVASNILAYLWQHPECILAARKFINTDQDKAVELVQRSLELEATNLQSADVQRARSDIQRTLDRFDEAYEADFADILKEEVMDIRADLAVVGQKHAADGLQSHGGMSSASAAQQAKSAADGLSPTVLSVTRKKRIVGGLLALISCGLGFHRFYLGQRLMGVVYVLLSWTTIPVIAGWAEGLRYLTMKNRDFYFKYCLR